MLSVAKGTRVNLKLLPAWLSPAPDSSIAANLRQGKSLWFEAIHLVWSVWVFITPLFTHGYDWQWALFTLGSYPLFVLLYAMSHLASRRVAYRYALGMVLLSFVLMPWYPSGISYFIYGCIMLHVPNSRFLRHLGRLLLLNAAYVLLGWLAGYPWQTLFSVSGMALTISFVTSVEFMEKRRDAELLLSQDEVRRLAATAERERIGRDLHDLLGHTLSLITLKLELSRKLFDRDHEAARRELEEAERVARHALAEVRSAVTGIRATDIAAELASARLLLESSAVQLECTRLPSSLPAEIERSLALVLREAVTNIARHAQATRAQVALTAEGGVVRLRIDDNGRGGIDAHGNGLSGMRERVHGLGGTLRIESPRRQGTHLCIEVPLPAANGMREQASEPGKAGQEFAPVGGWQPHGQHAT